MTVPATRHRFTVAEYQKMGEAGILTEDDRVELIEGDLIDMTPIGTRHLACVDRLNHLFTRFLGEKAIVRVQGSIRLSEHSEPQPDLALLRYRPDFYESVHAGPGDILLLVEVADTSTEYDRDVKVPLYARSGIAEVWLVDVNQGAITMYRKPGPDGYSSVSTVRGTDRLSPQAFPDLILTANQILGPHT